MAASNEWTEFHLTSNGWIEGSERLDFGNTKLVEPPKDRVLTRIYREYMPSTFSRLEKFFETNWISDNSELVNSLLREYPHPNPQDYYKDFSER
jgi:hypothetical protein